MDTPSANMDRDADAGGDGDFAPAFDIVEPTERTNSFVFDAPHSGSLYPSGFLAAGRLDRHAIRRSEDAHVDGLFIGMVERGSPLMRARFPRAYLDLNREPYELDPRMFEGRLPAFANTRSMRVAGGLGTIPRIVADGQEIYRGRIPVEEALARIETLYKPYHRALRDLLARTQRACGSAVLIDCHSMPSTSLPPETRGRVDVVLGDRYGASCDALLVDLVEASLRARGFGVARNKPYAGGFITEHYGQPGAGRHALQVEINRALYMDERTLVPHRWFGDVATALCESLGDVIAAFETTRRSAGPPAMAAE